MNRFKIILACLFTGMFCSCEAVEVREAKKVVSRTFGEFPSNVEFVIADRSGGTDSYSYEVKDGRLTVEGTSTIALTKGFHDYLLDSGYGISSWTSDRMDLPEQLPEIAGRSETSPFEHHLMYNVCTYGYTFPFWGWKEWEHEIDWLALHGFDMPLAPVAGEAILARVWSKLGLSREEIDEYFTGPAHFPWMRMGNMTKVDGGMSQEWHDSQIALQHKINDRMLALGMTPVYQGFAGFVPKAMKQHFPSCDIITTKWSGHESYMLSPVDSLFSVIGTEFIREWEKEFGKGEYYLCDSFNELDIPFGEQGSQERFDKLHQYSETIYRSIAAANPDAVWVMQGWMFGYQRDIWDPESIRALLSGAPDDKMMVIDLAVDYNKFVWRNSNTWDYTDGFFGKQWLWSTVPNFGGRTMLKGYPDFYLNGHLEALESANRANLTAYGTSPEGVEQNEVIYELISAGGWSSHHTDADEFLAKYTRARYGDAPQELLDFWAELRQSMYGNFTNKDFFLWQQRPIYHNTGATALNGHFFKGVEAFLSASGNFSGNREYETDAVQYAAIYLGAKAEQFLKQTNFALASCDMETARVCSERTIQALLDMDRLLESHPILRMQRWLDMAAACATNPAESETFKKEAKRLVSSWSGPSLYDYSARMWSGLIRDYYVPRLRGYFDAAMKREWVDVNALSNLFCKSGEEALSAVEPFEDPLKAAVDLVARYAGYDYVPGECCVPENEVGWWTPQDFGGKAKKRFSMSIQPDDFAAMEGFRFSNVHGCGRLTKVEFRSGSRQVGTVDLSKDLSKGDFTIRFKGPGSIEGLQRQVNVYFTFEGAADSSGVISYL